MDSLRCISERASTYNFIIRSPLVAYWEHPRTKTSSSLTHISICELFDQRKILNDRKSILPLLSSDQNSASTSGDVLDNLVLGLKTVFSGSLLHLLSIVVVGDTAHVDGRVGREEVLGTTSSVLGSTSGNVDDGIVANDFLVQTLFLLRSKHSTVVNEAILVHKLLLDNSLDIEQWVLEGKKCVSHDGVIGKRANSGTRMLARYLLC